MFYVISGFVLLIAVVLFLVGFLKNRESGYDDGFGFCVTGTVIGILGILILLVGSLTIKEAKVNVEFLNGEHGTTYTWQEYFWAGQTIKDNLLGNRVRVEME